MENQQPVHEARGRRRLRPQPTAAKTRATAHGELTGLARPWALKEPAIQHVVSRRSPGCGWFAAQMGGIRR